MSNLSPDSFNKLAQTIRDFMNSALDFQYRSESPEILNALKTCKERCRRDLYCKLTQSTQ